MNLAMHPRPGPRYHTYWGKVLFFPCCTLIPPTAGAVNYFPLWPHSLLPLGRFSGGAWNSTDSLVVPGIPHFVFHVHVIGHIISAWPVV